MATGGKATLLLVVLAIGAEALSAPKINYCRNRRPSECCRGVRDDDCSVPIGDTYCYCDDFCVEEDPTKEGEHTDCCPDFREVCLGEDGPDKYRERIGTETAVCYHEGRPWEAGTYTINCNECLCIDGRMNCEEDACLVDEEMLRRVQAKPEFFGWTAANYSTFWGKKAKEGLVLRTGTLQLDNTTSRMLPILLHPDLTIIPREFDARKKPEWSGYISGVMDQGWCGASWVFSTLGVAQDRQMILAHQNSVSLAPQQLLSCSPFQVDCDGGYVDRAWGYLRKHGAMEEKCYPYSSGASGKVPTCHRDTRTVNCRKYRMEPAYRISEKVEDIQWEIMTNGPVQAMMTVHRDLFLYRSGVYRCPYMDKEETGNHSVRILGWGEDTTYGYRPNKYWLVANSWGTGWGEGGLFKIQRGTNTCGIESFVLAVRGRRDPWLKNGSG